MLLYKLYRPWGDLASTLLIQISVIRQTEEKSTAWLINFSLNKEVLQDIIFHWQVWYMWRRNKEFYSCHSLMELTSTASTIAWRPGMYMARRKQLAPSILIHPTGPNALRSHPQCQCRCLDILWGKVEKCRCDSSWIHRILACWGHIRPVWK